MEKSKEIGPFFSEEYKDYITEMHKKIPHWGRTRKRLVRFYKFLHDERVTSFVDYGCGKGWLEQFLDPMPVSSYDPMVEEFSNPDYKSQGWLVCLDVLEHVEEKYLDNVLRHIYRSFIHKALFYISWADTDIFPDGTDAHITKHDFHWWYLRLTKYFVVEQIELKHADMGAFYIVTKRR